jgi:hypothetical protein
MMYFLCSFFASFFGAYIEKVFFMVLLFYVSFAIIETHTHTHARTRTRTHARITKFLIYANKKETFFNYFLLC